MKTHTQTKHTPGPWVYGFTEKSAGFSDIFTLEKYPDDFDRVSRLHLATVYVDGADDANARLIAAAPCLLAALRDAEQALKDICDAMDDEPSFSCTHSVVMEGSVRRFIPAGKARGSAAIARAAIARAEGREET
jgi:hypothetical protein